MKRRVALKAVDSETSVISWTPRDVSAGSKFHAAVPIAEVDREAIRIEEEKAPIVDSDAPRDKPAAMGKTCLSNKNAIAEASNRSNTSTVDKADPRAAV